MTERASKGDLRVVLASHVIPEGAKLVWLQDWILDPGGHGCWLTNSQLGDRLGMPERTVETYRLELAGHGLHERIPPGRTQARGWRSIVPADCRCKTANPDGDTIIRKRVILDDEIGRWRPPGSRPASESGRERRGGSNKERRRESLGEVRRDVGASYAFESQPLNTSPASQVHKANDVSTTTESTADEAPVREIDKIPAEKVAEAGFASIREIVSRNAVVRATRKVGS